MPLFKSLAGAWNAFVGRDNEPSRYSQSVGVSTGAQPQLSRLRFNNERTIVASIYTRLGIDVANINIRHAKLDNKDRFSDDADTELNRCLTWQANIDQSPREFRQDVAMSLFDEGYIAIVPVQTTVDPRKNNELFDILSLRVARIVDWKPRHVLVSVYNDEDGQRHEMILEKNYLAIVTNPLYSVMNEQNSTLQRLIRKLSLLDSVDEATSSGKLDIIIQLPYAVKSEQRRAQAETRRRDIEFQLKGSQYGIAYIDGTEKITQLNRPAENNLLTQIKELKIQLYAELGLTEEVMNGTADEATMINYYNRTIEPIVESITEAMQRAWLRNGFEDKERVMYFRNPFGLVPLSQLADIADKFIRNEILVANEIRGFMGIPPSSDPKADTLGNPNMPSDKRGDVPPVGSDEP